jgi:hypothetical protein
MLYNPCPSRTLTASYLSKEESKVQVRVNPVAQYGSLRLRPGDPDASLRPAKAKCRCGFVLLINYCNACRMKTLYPIRTCCGKSACFSCAFHCPNCGKRVAKCCPRVLGGCIGCIDQITLLTCSVCLKPRERWACEMCSDCESILCDKCECMVCSSGVERCSICGKRTDLLCEGYDTPVCHECEDKALS